MGEKVIFENGSEINFTNEDDPHEGLDTDLATDGND